MTFAVLLSASLASSACSSSTVTLAEADQRAQDIVRDVRSILGADAVDLRPEDVGEPECSSAFDRDATGQKGVTRSLLLRGSGADAARARADLERYALGRGFRVTSSRPPSEVTSPLNFSDDAGFDLRTSIGPERTTITVASPCVWPDGEPP